MSCERDREILNHIFNPLLPTNGLVREDEVEPDVNYQLIDTNYETQGDEMSKLELEGVQAAENGLHDTALSIFSQIIESNPRKASAYNNRAQLHRLMGKIEEAKLDLTSAINYSNGRGKTGCYSYCQRGLINLKEGQIPEAKFDFEKAASLGSAYAKTILISLNPHAALCNQMLRTMLEKIQNGHSEHYQNNNEKN